MRHAISNRSKQNGQALLAMVIIFIAASAYVLVTKLNANARQYSNQSSNQAVLNEARAALIGYALNFPEIDATSPGDPINGPGYLPCPDKDNDGDADSPCALAGPTNFTIGRFPYKSLEVSELRDRSGARLWYALSENYRNNPQLEPLNSETPGQLTVNGNGDIVAVIIAPGAPLGNQNRDPTDTTITTEIANYLETENNDLDLGFNSIDPSVIDVSDFNDRLITLTRQELMAVIEKRVLGEAKTVLTTYKATAGAYPWLSPFADPKTNEKRLAGSHSGADNQATLLTDASADFTQWGVAIGDIVWNVTDGSYGLVTVTPTALTKTTLTIGGGMTLGSENDFDTDDEYYVDIATPVFATSFIGTAIADGAGTEVDGDLYLDDSAKDFDALGVQIGDIVELVADGSSGVINSVTATRLTVPSLTGATNVFSINDVYRIRTSIGLVTSPGGLTLNDTNVDFTVMGIQAGDLVHNITDGSSGRVSVAPTANQLTVSELNLGANNTFNAGDYYVLPRFNGATNTREGLLSFHEQGEIFHTGFSIDWGAQAGDGSVVASTLPVTDPKSQYANTGNGIKEWVERSRSNNSGTITVSETDGQCVWINSTIAECKGTYTDVAFLSGTATSVTTPEPADDNEYFYDTSQDFDDAGVYEGDKVEKVAAGAADAGSSTTILNDLSVNFTTSGVAIGDTITNLTDGSSSIVATVAATQLTFAALSGGTNNSFTLGDQYKIVLLRGLVDSASSTGIHFISITGETEFSINTGDSYRISIAAKRISNTADALTDTSIYRVYDSELSSDLTVNFGAIISNATTGSGGLVLVDSTADFIGDELEADMLIYNMNLPEWFTIVSVDSSTQLTLNHLFVTGTGLFSVGDAYRGIDTTSTKFIINDTVVENSSSDGQGIMTKFGYRYFDGTGFVYYFEYTALQGGSEDNIDPSDSYRILYDYVDQREYEFNVRINGDMSIPNPIVDRGFNEITTNDVRQREICLGFGTACAGSGSDTTIPGDGATAMVTIRDYNSSDVLIGDATTTVPSAGAQGRVKVSGINLFLAEGYDSIPGWFFNNSWHQLIYVAYSAGDAPGAAAACVPGTNCLTINSVDNTGAPVVKTNNNNALVVSAGMEINTTTDSNCNNIVSTAQNRANGTMNEYYESDNCDDGDDGFQQQSETTTFNDQVRVVEP